MSKSCPYCDRPLRPISEELYIPANEGGRIVVYSFPKVDVIGCPLCRFVPDEENKAVLQPLIDSLKDDARTMTQYSIIHRPKGWPTPYVVNVSVVGDNVILRDETLDIPCQSLEEARNHIPEGGMMVARSPQDPEFLVESWMVPTAVAKKATHEGH